MLALGLVETYGLVGAIEAADVMLKSADVELLERNGADAGLVTITVAGEVSAVQASVPARCFSPLMSYRGLTLSWRKFCCWIRTGSPVPMIFRLLLRLPRRVLRTAVPQSRKKRKMRQHSSSLNRLLSLRQKLRSLLRKPPSLRRSRQTG